MAGVKRNTSNIIKCKDEADIPEKKKKVDDTSNIMVDMKFYILPAGIGKARCDIFKRQIENMGGILCKEFSENATTHVIVDDSMESARLRRLLRIEQPLKNDKIIFARSLWLSTCIREKKILDHSEYQLQMACAATERCLSDQNMSIINKKLTNPAEIESIQTKNDEAKSADDASTSKSDHFEANINKNSIIDRDSSYTESEIEDLEDPSEVNSSHKTNRELKLPKGRWVCAQSSNTEKQNYNKHITDKLEEMATTYEMLNDKWRSFGYQKAIMALKRHPKPITSFEEAKGLFGVGARLAEKIWEIAESGELCKLNEVTSHEANQAISLFSKVWGAGAQTARAWAQQGFNTLDDLRERANLTKNQRIGLMYYDEFLNRMPRSEAAEIEATVKEAALQIQPGLVAMACGSYRRGKQTCGDVDVLITHPNGKSHAGVYQKLIQHLHETGFLTDDLVSVENDGEHKKYLGVCKLPGPDRKHRRLDIIVVPYNEFACSLMYFTGSAHFNRSLRLLASKRGMSLNEHALSTGVVRSKGEKVNKGTPLPTPTEQSIFEHFGLTYRPPEEREH